MGKIVTDSSTLILLTKCDLIKIFCECYDVIAPQSVISEVASREIIRLYPDAKKIADLVAAGKIKIQNPAKSEFQLPLSLHTGEKDALLLATGKNVALFATDDGKAIKSAKCLDIPFIITPKIVLELFRLRKIAFGTARKSIEKLSIIGRYSPDIVANAFMALMEARNVQKTDNNKAT